MNKRVVACVLVVCLVSMLFGGCAEHRPNYGTESQLTYPGPRRQIWAVAPAVNLSGENVDPLLQADLLFDQLQQVRGITVLPVNRVAEIYASLKIDEVKSEDQAQTICNLLGCDGLVIPTITIYDPYDPPKFGATLSLFGKTPGVGARQAADTESPDAASADTQSPDAQSAGDTPDQLGVPPEFQAMPPRGNFLQAVGMFDAAAGTTRDELNFYATGRSDPNGPLGAKEYLLSMDRYCSFAYWSLTRQMLDKIRTRVPQSGGLFGLGGAESH